MVTTAIRELLHRNLLGLHLTLFHDSHYSKHFFKEVLNSGIRRIYIIVLTANGGNTITEKLFQKGIALLLHYVIKLKYRQADYGTYRALNIGNEKFCIFLNAVPAGYSMPFT